MLSVPKCPSVSVVPKCISATGVRVPEWLSTRVPLECSPSAQMTKCFLSAWVPDCHTRSLRVLKATLRYHWPLQYRCNIHSIFFLFFPSRHFFWTDFQKVLSEPFIINYQESVWPRSDSFLGDTKRFFRKIFSLSFYSWRLWHMTRLKRSNQHSWHPKKHKKQPETR